jgi:hypothetical protein
MKLGLDHVALRRIGSGFSELKAELDILRRCSQVAEEQSLDWRDLQDISSEITAAVQKQDLRRLMEAVEDMTSLMLSHIQMPEDTDVSQAFPKVGSKKDFAADVFHHLKEMLGDTDWQDDAFYLESGALESWLPYDVEGLDPHQVAKELLYEDGLDPRHLHDYIRSNHPSLPYRDREDKESYMEFVDRPASRRGGR